MEQKLTTENLKSNIVKSITFVFIALFSVIIYIILYSQNLTYKHQSEEIHQTINNTVKHTLEHNKDYYKFLLHRIIATTSIKEDMINNNRDGIYKPLNKKFELLSHENKYLQTLHIIDANGKSFLRVHKKDTFGDDLVSIRPMVKDMITNKKIIYGFETGKHNTSFRIMIPIFKEGKFLGSIGIGINPNFFIQKIAEIVKENGALFINNENLKLFAHKSKFSIQDYQLQTNLNKDDLDILMRLPKSYNFEDGFKIVKDDKIYILHSIDAKGFRSESYAKYLFMQDITKNLEHRNLTRSYIVGAIIFFALLIYFMVRYYLNRFSRNIDSFYNKTIETLKFNEEYLKAVEDNSSNIIVTSYGKALYSANKSFLKFTKFDSIDKFMKKYDCICELFVKRAGYLQTKMDGTYWINHIIDNPNKIHKAIMIKGDVEYIFQVTASKLDLDNHDRCVATFADITTLETLNDRYEIAINGSNDGLWDLDLLTHQVYYSPRWKTMLGYRDDELESTFKVWESLVHPDDLQQAYNDVEKALVSTNAIYENTHRLHHKDGHWVWILARGKVIHDENNVAVRMVGFHTDITKSKELELELKESKDQLSRAQSIAHIGNWEWDTESNMITLSEELYKIFGVQKDKFGGSYESYLEFVHPDDSEQFKSSTLSVLDDKKAYSKEYRIVLPSKDVKYLIEHGDVILDKNGIPIKLFGVVQDITDRKLAENALKEQEDIMIAQSRHAAMGEMISMIAHQWRQPLSIIAMGANNIMADVELDTVENKTLKSESEDIVSQTQELSRTIDDFKNFFRPVKDIEEVNPKDIFEEALKVIGKSLENNDIEIITKFNSDRTMQTYSRELMQVFINIIKNAKEALVENKIENKIIVISTQDSLNNIIIKICDNGGGIDNDIIKKVFNPYFTTKDQQNGTGLGLYMSKTIIEKHLNGTLEVKNENGGVCFSIVLPIKM